MFAEMTMAGSPPSEPGSTTTTATTMAAVRTASTPESRGCSVAGHQVPAMPVLCPPGRARAQFRRGKGKQERGRERGREQGQEQGR